MKDICPNCKKPPYPLFDENKKIIIRNLFHIDWLTLIMVIMLLFSAFVYSHDTAACRDIVTNPCKYISNYQCGQAGGLNLSNGVNEFNFNEYNQTNSPELH